MWGRWRMDDRQVGTLDAVVGEYVGTVTGYQPTVRAAKVRLRAPVPIGASVCIAGETNELVERLRPAKGLRLGKSILPAGKEVLISVRDPVETGADIFRLW